MKGNQVKIRKWGNSCGLLLPKAVLDLMGLESGDSFKLEIKEDKLILSPAKREYMTLAERFADYQGKTDQEEYFTDEQVGKEEI